MNGTQMRASPLQLKHLLFTRILVDPEVPFEQADTFKAGEFSFEDVVFHVNLTAAVAAGQEENPHDFMIKLHVGISNEKDTRAPYKIDIGVLGLFTCSEKIEIEDRNNIVTVNGASVLYGAIREQVATLTSRSYLGSMVLPTMDFRDHVVSKKKPSEVVKTRRVKKST